MPIMMMLSREVRRVPMDYEPPRHRMGQGWQPRFDAFYVPTVRQWLTGRDAWERRETKDSREHPEYSFEEWDGNGPDPDYYYPGESWPQGTVLGIQMYETVSEGTPISAVYEDSAAGREAMARELAAAEDLGLTTGMSVEEWLRIIDGQVLAKDIHTGELR